jgi:hypothetical protein
MDIDDGNENEAVIDSTLPIFTAIVNLLENLNFSFDKVDDKINLLSLSKTILHSKAAYYRHDLRFLSEKLFTLISNKQVNQEGVIYPQNNFNKNWINFTGKKYADEEWLYSFAKEDDRKDKDNEIVGFPIPSEMSSETQSRQGGTKQYTLLKKFQMKYPNDSYVIFNYNIDYEKKYIINYIDHGKIVLTVL